MVKPSAVWRRFSLLYRKEIWQTAHLHDRSPRHWFHAVLRVVSITATVFAETKAASRAAALSFSSLLGLGPLVAIAMLVAGLVLGQGDPNLAANTLNRLIHFVAPQIHLYEKLSGEAAADRLGPALTPAPRAHAHAAKPAAKASATPDAVVASAAPPAAVDGAPPATVAVNPQLVQLINDFTNGARSGSAGALGAFSLILIVLLLFKTIEDAFNEIWGVRRGRSWLMRVVFYWTILTLGAIVFFAAVTLLGAGAFVNIFFERLPFGPELLAVLRWSLPAFSFVLVVGVLTLFYRVIPNTRVFWRAAFIGALVVAALLTLNNVLAFLYVRRVLLSKSLYGSLGVLPVLMFGLYVFWLYLLIGGQISYAVQNVHFRNSQSAWSQLSESMRERLSLVVLLTIGRRFQACLPPVSASQLGTMLKVPTQILNESLNRLADMKLITPVPPPPDEPATDLRYQPARPLNRISLQDFKRLDDHLGADPIGASLAQLDPILARYDDALDRIADQDFFRKNLDELFIAYPSDESRPPFAPGRA